MKTRLSLTPRFSEVRLACVRSEPLQRFLALGFLLWLAQVAPAATNDLSTLLQRGLFEEEANHNFKAASEVYQAVVSRFDEDRKLAATAVFRLGEVYRKQGKTNDALAQYERVVREFADQTELVTLSRSQLANQRSAETAVSTPFDPRRAAEEAEINRMKALVKDSPDLLIASDSSRRGETPLHRAVKNKQLMLAEFLLTNGANVNAKDTESGGRTPLSYAVEYGHVEMVMLLLRNPADVHSIDGNGNTLLHLAARSGFKTIAELLLQKGADVQAATPDGYTPLHAATVGGFKSVIELLLAQKAPVNAVTKQGAMPIHFAVARGFRSVAELLLAHKAELNRSATDVYVDQQGNVSGSPLHLSAVREDISMMRLLLTNHADVEVQNNFGQTPLHLAAQVGSAKAAELLLAHGAKVDARDGNQWPPLITAVNQDKLELVRLLLKNKADPNAEGKSRSEAVPGAKPIVLATEKNNPEMVKILLEHGAHPDPGLLPAIGKSSIPIVQMLLDAGANPNSKYDDGSTPLHAAARTSQREIMEMLLAKGADPNLVDSYGRSALTLIQNQPNERSLPPRALRPQPQPSAYEPREALIQLLRRHGAAEDPPILDRIQVRRPAARYTQTVFSKGTNELNRFTLFEAIAAHYGFVSVNPTNDQKSKFASPSSFTLEGSLAFPDLRNMKLLRAAKAGPEPSVLLINLRASLEGGGCSDQALQWGDVIEIPEADHPINASWQGLANEQLSKLEECLKRTVQLTVKGQTTNILLVPLAFKPASVSYGPYGKIMMSSPQFTLLPVLHKSGLLRASSDLTRVKLSRRDKTTSQQYELMFDCSNPQAPPDVWLQDGDAIEVPEKP